MAKERKWNLRKTTIIGVATFVVISIILSILVLLTQNKVMTKKKGQETDPELARAMTYEQFVDGDENVDGTNNVKFSAFFLRDLDGDGYTEKLKGTCNRLGKQDTLYMELIVQTEGYLKDGSIEINGKNFYLNTSIPKDSLIANNYISDNLKKIELNTVNNGSQKMIYGIVRSGRYVNNDVSSAIGNNINDYSRNDNKIVLKGTYVDGNGVETPITKEIDLTVDWYGETKAGFAMTSYKQNDLNSRSNSSAGTFTLDFKLEPKETLGELKIYSNHVEGTIPELNGYAPIEVKMTSNEGTFTYNADTKVFTIDRNSITDEFGNITMELSRKQSYSIRVVYPLEAYTSIEDDTVILKIPAVTYFEGYNNPNDEFSNPYRSDEARAVIATTYSNPEGEVARFSVKVGRYISSPISNYVVSKKKPLRIYNGLSNIETEDLYKVRWSAYTGTSVQTGNMVMKETPTGEATLNDIFIKNDSSTESMQDVEKNIGIYFTGADEFISSGGVIKVYDDDTNILLKTFTKNDWSYFKSDNPYMYEEPVQHIRVEVTRVKEKASLTVVHIKEIDDAAITTKYTEEEFDNLKYIKSHLVGYLNNQKINTDTNIALYMAPASYAQLEIDKKIYSTQETEKNVKLTINASKNESDNQVGWLNGSFLIEIPEEIVDVKLKNVTTSKEEVSILTYEVVEQSGKKFIKINTKNEEPTGFNIYINCDITPDPRVETINKTINLYGANEEPSKYINPTSDIYDVNDNLNTEEKVANATQEISLIAPSSLLTNQTISEFDNKGSFVVSPDVADYLPEEVEINNDDYTAKVGVYLKNNYSGTISELLLIGKIPFEGNKYVLSEGDLGTEFTTTMTNAGLTIPAELENQIDIYYSETENPNKNLNDSSNGWTKKENVTDWSKIKTYLIDFKDVVMERGDEYVFNYTIKIPEGTEYNKVAYSHHGVYFSLDTEYGKYRTRTEPNKVGIRVSKKYNLDIEKYRTGRNNLVPGATYCISEIDTSGTEESIVSMRTATTDNTGKIEINNLYANRTYELKEIKSPEDYELNDNVVRFIAQVDEQTGNLYINKISGTTRGNIEVNKETGSPWKVTIKVEDEVKATLRIIKTEKTTNNPLGNIKFKITGTGFPSTGKIITTDENGNINVSGIKIGEEYTLTETLAEGHYINDPLVFRVNNNAGVYEGEIIEGDALDMEIDETGALPRVDIEIENESVPTYNLEIVKIKKMQNANDDTEQIIYLSGAKFALYREGKNIGEYTTDANGKVTINNLYQDVEGKDYDTEYTLKEIISPDGYAAVKDITFKAKEENGQLQLIEELSEGQTAKRYTVTGNTISITIEDSPSFKLTKVDEETNMPIANAKFVIYNTDNGEVAKDSKGEPIGILEEINGVERYVLTTDANGEITANLPEGFYKAVEVSAPEKYNITGKTYYFGIGVSREGKSKFNAEWAKSIGTDLEKSPSINSTNYEETVMINSCQTTDGCYVTGGHLSGTIELEGVTVNSTGNNKSYHDILITKYNDDEELEWYKTLGTEADERLEYIAATKDGGIVAVIYATNDFQVEGKTIYGGTANRTIVKLNTNGDVLWAKKIEASESIEAIIYIEETTDNGFIVGGSFEGSITIGGSSLSTATGIKDKFLIKYNENMIAQWGKQYDEIYEIGGIAETGDNGIAIVIDKMINNQTYVHEDEFIKYNQLGTEEWRKSFNDTNSVMLKSIAAKDNTICIGGAYAGTIEINGETFTAPNLFDIFIMKCNNQGDIEWVKAKNGGYLNEEVNKIAITPTGGIVAGVEYSGTSSGKSCYLESYKENGDYNNKISLSSNGDDVIKTIIINKDESIWIQGQYKSSLTFGPNQYLTASSVSERRKLKGFLIKYSEEELMDFHDNWAYPLSCDPRNVSVEFNYICNTRAGGFIAAASVTGAFIVDGKEYDFSDQNAGNVLIKYTVAGHTEWVKPLKNVSTVDYMYETENGEYIVATRSSSYDYFETISKINENLELVWTKSFTNGKIKDIIPGNNCEYVLNIQFTELTIGSDTYVSPDGKTKSLVVKLDDNGNILEITQLPYIANKVTLTKDGEYVVGYFTTDEIIKLDGKIIADSSIIQYRYGSSVIVKYDKNFNIEWYDILTPSGFALNEVEIENAAVANDGTIYAFLETNYNSIIIDGEKVGTGGSHSHLLIQYDNNGNRIWGRGIFPQGTTAILRHTQITFNENNEIIMVGLVDGDLMCDTVNNNNVRELITIENCGSLGYFTGFLLKYGEDGKYHYGISIGGTAYYDKAPRVIENQGNCIVVGSYAGNDFSRGGEEFHRIVNGGYWGFIYSLRDTHKAEEQNEIIATNSRKQYKITTDIEEIDGVKGGTISGEDERAYEKVKHGGTSAKPIIMEPDADYEIIAITVNGEEYPFTANNDGTYTMPQFTNVTENIHIVVKYCVKDRKMIINKKDSVTNEPLANAEFKLQQIEERSEPTGVIGTLTNNGDTYYEIDETDDVSNKIGALTNNGTYYFVENVDGTLTPTNSKTYQLANGGTAGKPNSTANSYMEIDLSSLTGKYQVVVNASVSSQSSRDYGYATITETTTAPTYSNSTGRFIYISGTVAAKDYTSMALEGGNTYYLHLGYYKNASTDTGDDQIVINSVKAYRVDENVYNFRTENGKYISTNQGKLNTVCNSYIPIDLTNYSGKYNIIVNAEINNTTTTSAGVAHISESTNRVAYNSTAGRIMYLYGEKEAADYGITVTGGKMYYLHLGYWKGANDTEGDDEVIINDIRVTLNGEDLYETTAISNSEGKAIAQVPYGKYLITEITAPEGYKLTTSTPVVEFRENGNHEFTMADDKYSNVIVHHYIKDTTTKLAKDEVLEGMPGENYETYPKMDLVKYELEKDGNEQYILPTNNMGQFSNNTIEVIYYYTPRLVPLVVHHYIEGTTTPVPLRDGTGAEDEISEGEEDEAYTTNALSGDELGAEYELTGIPNNRTGVLSYSGVEVVYEYNRILREVEITKVDEVTGETIAGARFELRKVEAGIAGELIDTYETDSRGKIEFTIEGGTYELTEIYVPGDYAINGEKTYFEVTDETEKVELEIKNDKKKGNIIVHHYIEKADGTKTTERILLNDGTEAEDETRSDYIGNMYATMAKTNISGRYKVTEEPDNASGEYIDGTIEVIYYYKEQPAMVTVHHYLEGTTTKLAEDVIIEKLVGDSYETEVATSILGQYKLVAEPTNKNGTMTEEPIEVIYYYKERDYEYIVNYLEKGTNEVLKEAKVVEDQIPETTIYAINEIAEIPGYRYDSCEPESIRIGTGENIINLYYTKKEGTVIVHYYLEGTTEKVSENITKTGLEGEAYTTAPAEDVPEKYELIKDDEGHYILPSNQNGTMIEGTIEVIYYYRVKDGEVIIKYVDENTGEELTQRERLEGKVDDPYEVPNEYKKEIVGYTKQDHHSGNEEGYIEVNPLEVIYYYKKQTKATVQYIDRTDPDNEVILEERTEPGVVGEIFETESKDFTGYILVEEPVEKNVAMTEEEIVLKYYYEQIGEGAKVVEKHIDVISGEILANETHRGEEGDEYNIPSRNFEGYDLVEDRLPTNSTGIMTGGTIEVIYYYKHRGRVIARYVDAGTGEEIASREEQIKHEGDEYTTEIKTIDRYELIEVPRNATGIVTKEDRIVIYYYKKKAGKVIVRHVDIETGKELVAEKKKEGYVGEAYETEAETIKNYQLVKEKLPTNAKGEFTSEEIEVVYYYRAVNFNLKIEKEINYIVINGVRQNVNSELGKAEIHRKELGTAKVQVVYSIKVTNDGELEGKATIQENIPAGMTMTKADNQEWEIGTTTATTETSIIYPGQSQIVRAVMDWNQGEENLGIITNTADIITTSNELGVNETKITDNKSGAQVIVAIGTGDSTYIMIASTLLLIMIGSGIVTWKRYKASRDE